MRSSDTSLRLLPVLYVIFLVASIALVIAANSQGVLTKEEASSGFVNPAFLEFRLQHHLFGTNFYAYAYFWITKHFYKELFYSRLAKAVIASTLPCFIFLYLRKRFDFGALEAFAAALGIAFLPGIFGFSWVGVDFGMEMPIGCCALWLALYDSTAAIVASSFLAAVSAETYGAGLAFLAAVAAGHAWHFRSLASRRTAVLAGFAVMAGTLAFPAFWWTNVQTLLTGGGTTQFAGAFQRLAQLGGELAVQGDSYYFFNNGAPALASPLIALLALAGFVMACVRDARRTWTLLLICVVSVAIYAIAGNVLGVRRAQPLVLALGIFAWLLLRTLVASKSPVLRTSAYVAFAVWMASVSYDWIAVRQGLSSAKIALPHDFEFFVPEGQTMASTFSGLLNGSIQLPQDLAGYEPDRTLCILYVLGKPPVAPSPREIIARCDQHGWSIRSASPRFMRLRHAAKRLMSRL